MRANLSTFSENKKVRRKGEELKSSTLGLMDEYPQDINK